MLELGENENAYHFEVGKFFTKLNFEKLITVGPLSSEIAKGAKDSGFPSEKINVCSDIVEAEKYIDEISMDCVILFKSSRDSGLNILVENLYGKK